VTRIHRDTLVCLGIALGSVVLLAWVIPVYTPPYPGYGASPALVPNVAVSIMLVMSILALVRNSLVIWWGKADSSGESDYPEEGDSASFTQVGRAKLMHLILFMVPCALLIPALDRIGFIPASILFLLVMQYLVGRRTVVGPVLLAVAMSALMYVVMRYGFSVPIPGT